MKANAVIIILNDRLINLNAANNQVMNDYLALITTSDGNVFDVAQINLYLNRLKLLSEEIMTIKKWKADIQNIINTQKCPHISIVEYLKLNRESYSIYYPNIDNDKKEKHYYLYCVLTKCLNIFKTQSLVLI